MAIDGFARQPEAKGERTKTLTVSHTAEEDGLLDWGEAVGDLFDEGLKLHRRRDVRHGDREIDARCWEPFALATAPDDIS
jgi:hypothetical protein